MIEKLLNNLSNIKIVLIYVLLGFGGLWNYLGYFQNVMQTLAGPLIIIISLILLYEMQNKKFSAAENLMEKSESKYKKNLIFFFIFVVIASWILEFVGVKTGYPFGTYEYGKVLKPQISSVPAAIGFAWFSTLIVSVGIMQKFTKINLRLFSPLKKALIAGFLMTVFDYVLEMAAIKLGYWTWQIGIVPTVNYLAWFVFGSMFAYIGYKFEVLDIRLPKSAHHFFFAQIIFFIISIL
ncbi:MAG: carotenoid biosynthesis protein [Candidatus Kapabacteria bacterium]|nr:carotenoid biosynthesis protein [Ignavibacteriota bacterium]MCW5885956.1 carotenoid biosynthesis protein [Candidatus Kapabacteria bacterium]